MTTARHLVRPLLAALVLAVTLLVPASASQADVNVPMVPVVGCKGDPPVPQLPSGTLGSPSSPPPIIYIADPFENPEVPIHAVYGWHYGLITYDNGCTPGSDLLPKAATEISNVGMEILGLEASAGHAMHSAVLNPMWLQPIDDAVASGVEAVRQATWLPWLSLVVVIIAVLMLWAARTGRLDSTVTTGVWALLVLSIVSLITTYPVETTKAVDGVVQGSANVIVSSFAEPVDVPVDPVRPGDPPAPESLGETATAVPVSLDTSVGLSSFDLPEPPPDPALQAMVDQQWDTLMRNTAYEAWLKATLGSSDTQTAKEYGPKIFKATHVSWVDWWVADLMPGDAFYESYIKAKQDDFVEVAAELAEEDPLAYQYMTGNKWGSRLGAVGMGLIAATLAMLFLVVAGIGMFIGFVIIRVAAFFAPAAGVIFMVERTRTMAIGFVQKIGKYVVMGPIFLLAGMVVLRINAAIAGSSGAWWLRLVLLLVVSYVAWVLTRPASSIPGAGAARKMLRIAVATAAGVRLAGAGGGSKNKGDEGSQSEQQSEDSTPSTDPPVYQPPRRSPLALGTGAQSPRALPPGDVPRDRDQAREPDSVPEYQAVPSENRRTYAPRGVSARRARQLSAGGGDPRAIRALGPGRSVLSPAGQTGTEQEGREVPGGDPSTRAVAGGAVAALTVNGSTSPGGTPGEAQSQSQEDHDRGSARDAAGGPVVGSGIGALTVREREVDPDSPEWQDRDAEDQEASTQQRPVAGGTVLVTRAGDGATAVEGTAAEVSQQAGTALPVGVVSVQREQTQAPQQPTEADQGVAGGVVTSGDSGHYQGQYEPQLTPEEVAAAARREGTASEVMVQGTVLPEQTNIEVHEANMTYDQDGRPVFTVYRPGGRSVKHA